MGGRYVLLRWIARLVCRPPVAPMRETTTLVLSGAAARELFAGRLVLVTKDRT